MEWSGSHHHRRQHDPAYRPNPYDGHRRGGHRFGHGAKPKRSVQRSALYDHAGPAANAIVEHAFARSAVAGGAAFTLTVTGINFVSGSVVQWNGAARTTAFVSATQLTAQVPASDIAAPGTASVTVQNQSVVSNALPFDITQAPAPPPSLSTLSPTSAVAGGAAFTLTVTGSNFVSGSLVQWNGAARTTAFVSATQLTAQISASDIAAPDTTSVTVLNQSVVSNALPFTITQAPPAPLVITTNSLPDATVNVAYSATLAASGGTPPYTRWSIVSGSLPKGLSLDQTSGVVSGTVTKPGSPSFTVQVTDAGSRTATKVFTIRVGKR